MAQGGDAPPCGRCTVMPTEALLHSVDVPAGGDTGGAGGPVDAGLLDEGAAGAGGYIVNPIFECPFRGDVACGTGYLLK